MADTAVAITAGSGTNIDTRTEGTNGNHRQVIVIGDPATNAGVAPVDATAGLKVDLGADNDVAVSSIAAGDNNIGNVDIASIAAGDNNIGNVDVVTLPALPAGTNNIGDVDVLTVNGVAPAFGSGVRDATVQRVTIATDDVVPASQSGTWNVTNVSGTVSLPTGAATSAKQDTIIGHIDGVETLLGTIDADTGNISTKIDTIAGAVSGTEMQVDVLTMPTTTVQATNLDIRDLTFAADKVDASGTVLGAGDNNIGNVDIVSSALPTGASTLAEQQSQTTHLATIAGDTTAIQAAVEIMDDWDNGASDGASVSGDVAHDTADAGEPVKIGMKAYELDGTAPQTAVAEGDRVNAIADLVGRQYVATEHPRFWHVSVDYASAQTNASVKAAPGAGVALYITDIMISNGATAGNITLLDGSGGTVLFELYPAINGGVSLNLKNPIKLTDNTALCVTSTTVTTHTVFVSGFID